MENGGRRPPWRGGAAPARAWAFGAVPGRAQAGWTSALEGSGETTVAFGRTGDAPAEGWAPARTAPGGRRHGLRADWLARFPPKRGPHVPERLPRGPGGRSPFM